MIIVTTNGIDIISGSVNNVKFNIPYNKELLVELKDLETKSNLVETLEEYKEIVNEFNEKIKQPLIKEVVARDIPGLHFNKETNTYHIKLGNSFSLLNIPEVLVNIIVSNFERKIESTPIINMCRRFLMNPKPTQERFDMLGFYVTQEWLDEKEMNKLIEEKGYSEELARKYATFSDIQITQEGYLKCSKVVEPKEMDLLKYKGELKRDESGRFLKKDALQRPIYIEDMRFSPAIYTGGALFYSGTDLGYIYRVGQIAALPYWSQVEMSDNREHFGGGLYCGGMRYVENYVWGSRVLLDVFVCPSMIGKFTQEGIGELTCKEMYVYGGNSLTGTMKGLYHTSTYSKIQSSELIKRIEEELKNTALNAEGMYEVKSLVNKLKGI